MSSIDDIWASLKSENDPKNIKLQSKSKTKKAEITTKEETGKVKKEKGEKEKKKKPVEESEVKLIKATKELEPVVISYADMTTKIARDVNGISDNDILLRKRSLISLKKILFEDHTMSDKEYSQVFRDICKALFKRYTDPVEKCRELSATITSLFFQKSIDLVPVLGYYFPALIQRIPSSNLGYDDELKVFINDKEHHEAYKRGKAVERSDKTGVIGVSTIQVIETSEEIRLTLLQTINELISRIHILGSYPILHPYFEDMIIFIQYHLKDPYPEVKYLSCQIIDQLAKILDYSHGFKLFSIAIIRALLPVLRHRHIKVRSMALIALQSSFLVPDRNKRKSAGSEAIMDLIGFREENVLPIAAFYSSDVTVNYLAEILGDSSMIIKENLLELLHILMTKIEDYIDFQQRLLPYLLDLLIDDQHISIAQKAYAILQECAKLYEKDHYEEILEIKQYNIDGDLRMNLSKVLPPPLHTRPMYIIRLFVRAQTKRFLFSLLNEIQHWQLPIQYKSLQLLKFLLIFNEEHLTSEIYQILPQLVKAWKIAYLTNPKETQLHLYYLEIFELLGRYILPNIYLFYLIPRIKGEQTILEYGIDNDMKIILLQSMRAMLLGSKANELIEYLFEIINVCIDPYIMNYESKGLITHVIEVLYMLFYRLFDSKQKIIEAYYLSTGRLTSLYQILQKLLKFLLIQLLFHVDLSQKIMYIIKFISLLDNNHIIYEDSSIKPIEVNKIDEANPLINDLYLLNDSILLLTSSPSPSSLVTSTPTSSIKQLPANNIYEYLRTISLHNLIPLFHRYLIPLIHSIIEEYTFDCTWSEQSYEHKLLLLLLEYPLPLLQSKPQEFHRFIDWCIQSYQMIQQDSSLSNELQYKFMRILQQYLVYVFRPILLSSYSLDQMDILQYIYPISSLLNDSSSEVLVAGISPKTITLSEMIEPKLSMLFEQFIFHFQWSKTYELSFIRLKFLSMFIGYSTHKIAIEENDDENALIVLKDELLIKEFPSMVQTCIPMAILPSSPLPLRLQTMQTFQFILQNINSFNQYDKIYSYVHWGKYVNKIQTTDKEEVRRVYLSRKEQMQSFVIAILPTLYDGDDQIRLLALQMLLQLVYYLPNDEEWKEILGLFPKTKVNKGDIVSFSGLISILCQQVLIEMRQTVSSVAYLDHLDMLLRSLAMLDLGSFEQLVRQEFPHEILQNNESLQEFVNGLLNHVDILTSLMGSL